MAGERESMYADVVLDLGLRETPFSTSNASIARTRAANGLEGQTGPWLGVVVVVVAHVAPLSAGSSQCS